MAAAAGVRDPATDLLSCLRWDAAGERRLAALGAAEWRALLAQIEAGHGQALLARRLARSPGILPPAEVTAALDKALRALALRNMRGIGALARCMTPLGRPVLLLKGVDLAQRVYGNVAQRRMGDIDILVRPEDVPAVHAALIAGGYTTTRAPTAETLADAHFKEADYRSPDPAILPLDLHWRLTGPGFGAKLDGDGIWARALPASLFGPGTGVMAPEDLLLYLCDHIRHHSFDGPLTQLWDLAEVIDWAGTGFDWQAFWARAAAWRFERTVQLAFAQLERDLGVAAPAGPDAAPDPAMAALLPSVLAHLGRHPRHEGVNYRHIAVVFTPDAPWRDRAGLLLRAVFAPRAEVAQWAGLPTRSLRAYAAYPGYWYAKISRRGALIRGWLRRDPAIRGELARVESLHAWLDAE
jgi:hypothetical protein